MIKNYITNSRFLDECNTSKTAKKRKKYRNGEKGLFTLKISSTQKTF